MCGWTVIPFRCCVLAGSKYLEGKYRVDKYPLGRNNNTFPRFVPPRSGRVLQTSPCLPWRFHLFVSATSCEFHETKIHVWLLSRKFCVSDSDISYWNFCFCIPEWETAVDISYWNPVCGRTSDWCILHYVNSSSSNVNALKLVVWSYFHTLCSAVSTLTVLCLKVSICRPLVILLKVLLRWRWVWSIDTIMLTGKPKYSEKILSLATLSTTVSHEMTRVRTHTHGERPATKRLKPCFEARCSSTQYLKISFLPDERQTPSAL